GSRGWACRPWQARAWPPPSARQPTRSQDISRTQRKPYPCCPSTARPPHRTYKPWFDIQRVGVKSFAKTRTPPESEVGGGVSGTLLPLCVSRVPLWERNTWALRGSRAAAPILFALCACRTVRCNPIADPQIHSRGLEIASDAPC